MSYKNIRKNRKFRSVKKELSRYDKIIENVSNIDGMSGFVDEMKRRRSLVASEIGKKG